MDKDLLREHHEGLIALSACLGGEVAQCLLAGKFEDAKAKALEYQEIFGKGNYFLEIQKHPHVPDSEKIEAVARQTFGRKPASRSSRRKTATIFMPKMRHITMCCSPCKPATNYRMTIACRMKEDDFSVFSPEAMAEKFAAIPGGRRSRRANRRDRGAMQRGTRTRQGASSGFPKTGRQNRERLSARINRGTIAEKNPVSEDRQHERDRKRSATALNMKSASSKRPASPIIS